jgi:hypothetical protein
VATYLQGDQASLLSRLATGQRTPLFALGHQILDRYAWYQRLVTPEPHWHSLSGLIRCEVRMEIGLETAQVIANALGAHLPRFAGRPGLDPRAPQNLAPVGALEAELRHRLGHSGLMRRVVEARVRQINVAPATETVGA